MVLTLGVAGAFSNIETVEKCGRSVERPCDKTQRFSNCKNAAVRPYDLRVGSRPDDFLRRGFESVSIHMCGRFGNGADGGRLAQRVECSARIRRSNRDSTGRGRTQPGSQVKTLSDRERRERELAEAGTGLFRKTRSGIRIAQPKFSISLRPKNTPETLRLGIPLARRSRRSYSTSPTKRRSRRPAVEAMSDAGQSETETHAPPFRRSSIQRRGVVPPTSRSKSCRMNVWPSPFATKLRNRSG